MSICPVCKHSDQTDGHSFTSAEDSDLGIPIRACPAVTEGSAYIHAGPSSPSLTFELDGPGLTLDQCLAMPLKADVEPLRTIRIEGID